VMLGRSRVCLRLGTARTPTGSPSRTEPMASRSARPRPAERRPNGEQVGQTAQQAVDQSAQVGQDGQSGQERSEWAERSERAEGGGGAPARRGAGSAAARWGSSGRVPAVPHVRPGGGGSAAPDGLGHGVGHGRAQPGGWRRGRQRRAPRHAGSAPASGSGPAAVAIAAAVVTTVPASGEG